MRPADEFADLGGGAYRWEAYDPASRVDLSASAAITEEGLYFIDPIPLREEALRELLETAGVAPAGVFLTNENHERASAAFSRRLGVPVYSSGFAGALTVVPLPGGAAGEAAVWLPKLLVVGDALINLPSLPFSVLPDKYCADPRQLRASLATLLTLDFDRMLFAHGDPLMSGARARLAALLALPG